MKVWIHWTILDCRTGRICLKIVTAFPVVLRSDRSGTKPSATIRADIVQDLLDTGTAESAFKRANQRLR